MDKERHSDHFGEGLFIGILIGHYLKPYDAPLDENHFLDISRLILNPMDISLARLKKI